MKKSVILGLAALALSVAMPAKAQEVQYVPDCTQGQLINRNVNNWFLTGQGGANVLFGKGDVHAPLKDRICGQGALYLGKWVTPTFGFRFGVNYEMTKGATHKGDYFWKQNATTPYEGDWYAQKWEGLGPEFDVLINLTNWWCGYKPNRVYNAYLHGGAGAYWRWYRGYKQSDLEWRAAKNTIMFATLGLQNNFRVSKHVDLFLDFTYQMVDEFELEHALNVNLGLTVNFGKTDWNCPITAVCPTWKYTDAEGDALVAKLNQAENKIASLQQQLDACLRRPTNTEKVNCEGLATVYYPINQSGLSKREKTILKSVASVMQENPNQKYILTGWADNYTGNDEINTRLRNERVNGVKSYLVQCGVPESQLEATIDANNLTDFGVKGAPLDRAVTIKLAD